MIAAPFTDISFMKRCLELASKRSEITIPGLLVGIHDTHSEGFIALANRAFEQSDAPFFGYMAQDAFPGRKWLRNALNSVEKTNAGLLGFNDGKWAGALAGFGLVRRSWAVQNYGGPLFNPAYHSHYADAELTLLALNEGKYTYDPEAVLVEVDWEKDQKKVNTDDRALFQLRAASGFDDRIKNPLLLSMFA